MLLGRRRRGDRHGWNSWDNYLAVHRRCIDDFGEFIEHNGLTYTDTPELVQWDGRLRCQGGYELTVSKYQDRRVRWGGQIQVRTIRYSYHATRARGDETINVLRYDNIHAHGGHPDEHHLHVFDGEGTEVEVRHVGSVNWPVLSEVVDELMALAFPPAGE